MAYKITITLFLLGSILSCSAQDTMYLMNGDTMAVKVTEVSETEVRYKLQSNLNGPAYVIAKTKIFMVEYENGSKDVFARENTTTPAPRMGDPTVTAKRTELEKLHRRKLGGGIAGVIFGSVGTAVAGSAFAYSLTADLEPPSRVEDKTIVFGFATLFSIVVLSAGIGSIVRSGEIRRELNALPVAIAPVLLAPAATYCSGQQRGLVYGIGLAYDF